ncbi:MAG: HNH endonuclease [Acidobacteriota bacterium]|nr:HNH endonuclease [Acidobacteriota bacterium]
MPSDIRAALRAEVARRADHRCEYCLIHEDDSGFPHQLDHIVSRKHGGSSTADNLAYACALCNRHKGTDVASTDLRTGETVRLFHPRRDLWTDHFRLERELFEPITGVGDVTLRLLRPNATERVAERRLLQELGRYPSRS